MAPANQPEKAINPVALQLLVVGCHAATVVLTAAILVTISRLDLHGRGIAWVAILALFAPSTLSGYVYRRLAHRGPTSGFTWWMAFLFTLCTFGIIAAASGSEQLPPPAWGLDRMQTGGLILGLACLSVLVSAVLFRLGASTEQSDQDIISRMLRRLGGR